MSLTPVYVVLVNYNGFRDTIECLESLVRGDYAARRVVVLDNGSTDRSVEEIMAWAAGTAPAPVRPASALSALSTPPVPKPIGLQRCTRAELDGGRMLTWDRAPIALVECGANLGFAGANNVALRYVSRADPDAYTLLLNNDTVIAPNAIGALVHAAKRDERVGAVGATLLQYHSPERVETLAGATVHRWNGFSELIGTGLARRAHREPPAMDFISGCCMLVTAAARREVGGIDERFFLYCEDADWGLRATAAGFSLVYCAEAEVWHKGGATSVPRSVFHDYHTAKSVLHFVRKHEPLALPAAAAYLTARMLASKVLRGEWQRFGAVLRGCRDFALESLRPGRTRLSV